MWIDINPHNHLSTAYRRAPFDKAPQSNLSARDKVRIYRYSNIIVVGSRLPRPPSILADSNEIGAANAQNSLLAFGACEQNREGSVGEGGARQ